MQSPSVRSIHVSYLIWGGDRGGKTIFCGGDRHPSPPLSAATAALAPMIPDLAMTWRLLAASAATANNTPDQLQEERAR
jgi:hypothetical protein